jgi:hypothetical protein
VTCQRAGRRYHRLAVLLLLVSLAASIGPCAGAQAASSSTSHVKVAIQSLSPSAPQSGQTLHLSGTFSQSTGASLYDVEVLLRVHTVAYRDSMATSQRGTGTVMYNYGDLLGTVSGTGAHPWSLAVPVDALQLFSSGVYALDVEVIGRPAPYDAVTDLGDTWTYIPWEINASINVALVWPLVSTPSVDGSQDASGTPELANDDLATQLATGGRLSNLVADASGLNVNWLVDPDLIGTVTQMTEGYSLPTSSASSTSGTSAVAGTTGTSNAASQWLAAAKTATSSGQVWSLPYADPDIASLSHSSTNLTSELTDAARLGTSDISKGLGRTPSGTIAWPADGQADAATLATARSLNPSALLVSDSSVPLSTPNQTYTPTGHATVDGMSTAVSDSRIDAIFAGDPVDAAYNSGSNSQLLASQRFIAETALIALQRPLQSRTIVVEMPRSFAPTDTLVQALRTATGWVHYVNLSTVTGGSTDPNVTVGTAQRTQQASQDRSAASMASVASLASRLSSFAAILSKPIRVNGPYQPAVLRALATSWRTDPNGAAAFINATGSGLDTLRNLVGMVPKTEITLSGKSGDIPITIHNNLSQDVTLQVQVSTRVNDQLRVAGSVTVTIHTGSEQIVQIPASASVSGSVVPITVRLVALNGQQFGDAQTINVRITDIGVIALVILFVSGALLVVAIGFRLYRAARRARHGSDGDSGDPDAVLTGASVRSVAREGDNGNANS